MLFVKPSDPTGVGLNHQMTSVWEKKPEYPRPEQQLQGDSKSTPSPDDIYMKSQHCKSIALDLKLDPAPVFNCK